MKEWYPEADLVIRHPKVYTVALTCEEIVAGKRDFPIIDDGGVAVKDGRIIAVGAAEDVDAYIGEHTRLMDAAGKTLTPGFIDSHVHAMFLAEAARNIDFSAVTSRDEVRRLIEELAADSEPGEWMLGSFYDEQNWDVKEPFTSRELDEIAPENPILFKAVGFSRAMTNSAALAAAGITRDTPDPEGNAMDPEGGTIGHYDDGEPNGLLYGLSTVGLVDAVVPPTSQKRRVEGVDKIGVQLASLGLTSVVDANLSYDEMRAYQEARKQGKLHIRTNTMYFINAQNGSVDIDEELRRLDEMQYITGFGDDMFKINGVKTHIDGVPQFATSLMRREYKTTPGNKGQSYWSQEDLNAMVCKATELGWQVGIHAIGDAAADMTLEAYKLANDTVAPIQDRHDYIIHYFFPQEDQWELMRELKVPVTMQPANACAMGAFGNVDEMFYEDELPTMEAPGVCFKNGILVSGSSDAPYGGLDPKAGMYYAVTRRDAITGQVLSEGDESKVTPIEALIMYTKNSAYFSHDEDQMGSVEVGNLADFVILDRDCFGSDDPQDILDAKIDATLVGGELVYER